MKLLAATPSPEIGQLSKVSMLLFMATFMGCHVGSCCNVRPLSRRIACEANLKKIGGALTKYIALHGDLPRNNKGQISISDALNDPKVQKEVGVDSSVLQCPADTSFTGSSYMFNPALTTADFASNSTTVVACDKQPCHQGLSHPADSPASVILLGDGAVKIMYLPLKERENWTKLFLAGDKRACKYPKDGGWYTGADLKK